MLALLRAVGCNRAAIAWLIIFISLVGAAQMLWFGSRRPREASLLAGAVALPVFALLIPVIHGGASDSELGCLLMSTVLFGAPTGYLAGGIVAGVFLIMDAVQRQLNRLSKVDRDSGTGA